MTNRTLGALAVSLLASLLVAAPTAAVSAGVATDPLASSQAAAAEIATFWLSGGGANLAAATPYSVQTAVDKITTGGGGISPDTKPGSTPPSLPATTGTAPTTAGKVFFVGADGQPHWCTGTAVQSQYRNVVATAAHCVYDTERFDSTLDKWVFVPGYAGGTIPSGLYVGKQLFGHYDFDAYRDYDRDYAFVVVYEGVVPSPTGGLANFGRLGDNVGGQGLAWNQPMGSTVDVFGYPAGQHPDGKRPYTGETLESSRGRTITAMAPSLKGENLQAVDSPFTGEGSLGSAWMLRYDKASGRGYLNGLTISVADTDADLRYDTSLSPYFDGELAAVYSAASTHWSGAVLPG
ncbi:S1 family peptidase [Nonomuraea sp. NBC_00507]|uniref:trypsin-like serine peptidase n=1 Tax=Nonomuraea sp. NBC_00507 TaxID=2976002 RepID=UPI002E187FCE